MPKPDITIYHNPNCGTSRNVLAFLHEAGHEPEIVEYLKAPLSRAALVALIEKMSTSVRSIVREKESLFQELNLAGADDDALLDAMVEHPILMNRPIVVVEKDGETAARLCRPSEAVKEFLAG